MPEFTMVTDDYRLRQILNNLISNAIKFTHEGHITFGYTVQGNRSIEFFVSDSGMGIPLNKQRIIFDRFGQVDQDREYRPSGTGLGLPISKNLVKLMGGEMWVDSKMNEGTTFFFTLPVVKEKTVEEPSLPISNKSYNWDGKCILVAEDEPLNWLFIKEMLRKTGAEVLHAKNGREVIRIARDMDPGVILMDIKMPEINGIEATRKIREFNKEVPIIAQTAFVMAEEREESRKAGCDFFVTKPLDRTELMEMIDNCLKSGK